ncbi:hypothetical protein F5Y18DRAFT_440612 [Xylariaceae sp. FL1019]|nr:hypothetical protein F5Y18DRAFT_440612 [Xylariaceae sp. FL1019]
MSYIRPVQDPRIPQLIRGGWNPLKDDYGPPPPPRPAALSPWAQRFGTFPSTVFDEPNLTHSGLSTRFPTLDPKWDHVLFEEAFQSKYLAGIQSYQLAPLHKWLNFGPKYGLISGGHTWADRYSLDMCQAIFDSETIDVDENAWFPWLQKDRWYNTKFWSVDDDKVWQAIRPAVELCNLIWYDLIHEEHTGLQTFLYGRLDYWDNWDPNPPQGFENKTVLLSLALERDLSAQRGIPCFGEYMTMRGKLDWAIRLSHLTKYITWHVADMEKDGLTDWAEMDVDDHITYINSTLVRSLMDSSITLSERCLITLNLAVTLLHESMHAIIHCRVVKDKQDDPAWFLDPSREDPDEPALGFEDYPYDWELGVAFEHTLFGGRNMSKENTPHFGGIPMCGWLEPYPLGDYEVFWPRLTSLWASQLLSKSFWENERTPGGTPFQKSANNFQRRTVVESRPSRDARIVDNTGLPASVMGFDPYQQVALDWLEREDIIIRHRHPWFPQAREAWDRSPWSETEQRIYLKNIEHWYRYRLEVPCAATGDDLLGLMKWAEQDRFLALIPTMTNPAVWCYYWAAGLLLMAAMPLRKTAKEHLARLAERKLVPSQQMIQKGHRTKEIDKQWGETPLTCNEAELCANTLGNDNLGGRGKLADFGHEDILDVLKRFLVHLMDARIPVCVPWFEAIREAYQAIRDERKNMRLITPNSHESRWCTTWPFKIPEYDPDSWASSYTSTHTQPNTGTSKLSIRQHSPKSTTSIPSLQSASDHCPLSHKSKSQLSPNYQNNPATIATQAKSRPPLAAMDSNTVSAAYLFLRFWKNRPDLLYKRDRVYPYELFHLTTYRLFLFLALFDATRHPRLRLTFRNCLSAAIVFGLPSFIAGWVLYWFRGRNWMGKLVKWSMKRQILEWERQQAEDHDEFWKVKFAKWEREEGRRHWLRSLRRRFRIQRW